MASHNQMLQEAFEEFAAAEQLFGPLNMIVEIVAHCRTM